MLPPRGSTRRWYGRFASAPPASSAVDFRRSPRCDQPTTLRLSGRQWKFDCSASTGSKEATCENLLSLQAHGGAAESGDWCPGHHVVKEEGGARSHLRILLCDIDPGPFRVLAAGQAKLISLHHERALGAVDHRDVAR